MTKQRAGVEPPRTGLYRRFFAWLLSRLQSGYGDEVDRRKRELIGAVSGTVVEIGPGAGANLPLYPADVRLLLVEPNAHMRPYLDDMAGRHGATFELRGGTAERMDVDDGCADYVVCTLVLCSVGDPAAAIREVLRVLKPGGRFVFLEHVAAPAGSGARAGQGRLRPIWRRIGDGCTLDRETWITIEQAGFESCAIEHFEADGAALVRPHVAGIAVKAGGS